jgi:hypothetical protein
VNVLKRTYAFTGIPGTGIQSALNQLADAMRTTTSVRVICIDKYLWEEFVNDAREKSHLLRMTDLKESDAAPDSEPNWWNILTLPLSLIRKYWRLGAQRALQEINDSEEDVIFIAFHSFYQSDDYRWRFSAVDPTILRSFNFAAFFTLIDDIYDAHRRRKDDVRADVVDATGKDLWEQATEQITLTIEYLEQVVIWRQEEIVLTDLFAAASNVPSHVFAVKHPLRTLIKLINDPHFSYYFSHPITAVRAYPDFTRTQDFMDIFHISNELRRHTTIIEPTTIDEFRLLSSSIDGRSIILPKLGPRWPLPGDVKNLLYSPIELPGGDSDFSFAGVNATDLGIADECEALINGEAPQKAMEIVSLSLQRLSARIAEDITWRDHHLVDQTKRLIVFRPMQKGKISGGVRREIKYYEKLALTEPGIAFSCLVYHPEEDRQAGALRVAELIISDWHKHTDVGPNLRPPINEMDQASKQALLQNVADAILSEIDPRKSSVNVVKALDKYLRPSTSGSLPMESGRTLNTLQRTKEVREAATNCALKAIRMWHYIEPLATHRELGIKILFDHDSLSDEVERVTPQGTSEAPQNV